MKTAICISQKPKVFLMIRHILMFAAESLSFSPTKEKPSSHYISAFMLIFAENNSAAVSFQGPSPG